MSIIGIPDRFYHSSQDTPDKVSAKTLDQTGLVLATYLYLLADAGPETAGWLAEEAASRGRRMIVGEGERFIREALEGDAEEGLARGKKRLPFLAEQHNTAVASALRFGRDEKVVKKVKRLQEGLGRAVVDALFDLAETAVERVGELQKQEEPVLGEVEKKAEGLVPKRNAVGPLTLEPLLLKEEGPFRWAPSWCAPHNDVLIWADGKRSILEICKCAHLESGRRIDLEEIVEFFEFLVEKGYVEWCAVEEAETGEEA